VTSREVEDKYVHVALMPPMEVEQGRMKVRPVTVTLPPEGELGGVMLLTTFA
jgi:hypothetical protein